MIEFRDGDIFEQKDLEVILHQANCFNRMQSGIAKTISEKYPEAVEADNRTHPGDKAKLGSYTCGVGANGIHIINLYGQFMHGSDSIKTDYTALKNALIEFKEDYHTSRIITGKPLKIGIPYKIGAGLAGGDWNVILQIIKDLFELDDAFIAVICKKD